MSLKITYSLSPDNLSPVHENFQQALNQLRSKLPLHFPAWIGNTPVQSKDQYIGVNPADRRMQLTTHRQNTLEQLDKIMALANATQKIWRKVSWQQRIEALNNLARVIEQQKWMIAAAMSLEVGKSRLESLGEVDEAIDLIHYYTHQMEQAKGFYQPMGALTASEHTCSILKPYGVFAIIVPFNFPLALAVGALAAAVVTGNTVVLKIATASSWTAQNLFACVRHSQLPEGVVQLLMGDGQNMGQALAAHPLASGMVFTGSYQVGMELIRRFGVGGRWPRPCIVEMGGKNPGIICPSANLDQAVTASWKSAFGLSGQKCSALSRLYVHQSIKEEFVAKLVAATQQILIGDPTDEKIFLGPVINKSAVDRYYQAKAQTIAAGGKIILAAEELVQKIPGYSFGHFVPPAIVEVPKEHPLTEKELFLPWLQIYSFGDLPTAINSANDVPYGLSAGIFSQDLGELEYFFDHIQAGVTYANRPSGITTGAWPGVNSFCGHKASGSTGRGFCGPYYVAQFLQEQSQTRHY